MLYGCRTRQEEHKFHCGYHMPDCTADLRACDIRPVLHRLRPRMCYDVRVLTTTPNVPRCCSHRSDDGARYNFHETVMYALNFSVHYVNITCATTVMVVRGSNGSESHVRADIPSSMVLSLPQFW